ncbi:hypothetical protein [Glycomyces xiaoerkulensis]|uniref:hypothetical protein n=1 Tax=Glycomyces xiaoerkulensis TaxID=2038139 RepID=UPI000C266E82|nr:hypothetical protein [Glycomyces xiaoerkulensis]
MSPQRHDEAEATRALRSASDQYEGLPGNVADRLDRVLDQLPTADTLHAGENRRTAGWAERMRARRVRYALVSAAAALLVTIGGVAVALQYVSGLQEDSATVADAGGDDGGAQAESEEDPEAAIRESELEADSGEDFAEEPESAEETTGIATFSTGRDYQEGSDLLSALRELSADSATEAVPEELEALAEGGRLWQDCQEALAEAYESLPVAVDFARYDSEPAVVALLVSDSGEIAVAVTPECAQGEIEPLVFQQ